MALTPSELGLQRTRLRLLLQEPTPQYWTDGTLNAYINEAQLNLATGIIPGQSVGEVRLLASEATTPSVASQELYSLPPNFTAVRTIRVRATSTETYMELPRVDIEYARVHPRQASASRPEKYFLWAESGTYQIGMYPPFNSANGMIYVSYWRRPVEMTADSDALQIPPELHVANTYLAAHKAWLERGHREEAADMLTLFTNEYTGAMSYINRTQIDASRAVMVGTIGDSDAERTLY